jgi:hypothetical protein
MGVDDHDLDWDFFIRELISRLPPPVQLIFTHLETPVLGNGWAFVLPPDIATHFALEHPRIEGSGQLGLKAADRIVVAPNDVPAADLHTLLVTSSAESALIWMDPPDTSTLAEHATRIQACLSTLGSNANLDLIVRADFVRSDETIPFRRWLLEGGHVTDLFDCGPHTYVGWLGPGHDVSDDTQVVKVPPADQWDEFIRDLEDSWLLLWKWGDLSKLRAETDWTADGTTPDLISMLLRLTAELDQRDSSSPSEANAYMQLRYIELGLRYLLQLRLGDNVEKVLAPLPEKIASKVRERMTKGDTLNPYDCFDHVDFKTAIGKSWTVFGSDFHPSAKGAVIKALQAVNDVRLRAAHPTRLATRRITSQDLLTLDRATDLVRKAIERAESDLGLS